MQEHSNYDRDKGKPQWVSFWEFENKMHLQSSIWLNELIKELKWAMHKYEIKKQHINTFKKCRLCTFLQIC